MQGSNGSRLGHSVLDLDVNFDPLDKGLDIARRKEEEWTGGAKKNLKEVDRAVQQVGDSAAKSGGGLTGMFDKVNSKINKVAESSTLAGAAVRGLGFGAGLSAFNVLQGAIGGAVGAMGDMIGAASDLSETQSKVGVVFGSSAKDVLDWANDSATAMGISQNAALTAAGTYGNLFVSMGMIPGKAAEMSKGLVELAGDLASFNNQDPTEVMEKLRSGLVGETEPLRSLGVNLSAVTVQQKALEMGLWDGKGAIDASAKAQASYALILEQTQTAQGDFGRTSNGLANSQRILDAELENVKTQVGKFLLPIWTALVQFLSRIAIPALGKVADGVGFVFKAVDTLKPGIIALALIITATLIPAFIAWAAAAVAAATATIIAFAPVLVPLLAVAAAVGVIALSVNNLAIDFGDMGARIHKIADKTGRDYDEVKKNIQKNMDETGASFEEAAKTVEYNMRRMTDATFRETERQKEIFNHAASERADAMEVEVATAAALPAALQAAADASGAIVSGGPGHWAAKLKDGTQIFAGSADNLASKLTASMQGAHDASVDIAEETPKDLTDALIFSQDDIQQWKDQLKKSLVDPVTDARALLETAGILGSKSIAKGLTKGSTSLNDSTLTMMDDQLATIEAYVPDFIETGKGIPKAQAKGVDQNLQLAIAAITRMRNAQMPGMNLAEFAESQGYANLAAYIRGMESQRAAAATKAGQVAVGAAKMMNLDLFQPGYNVAQSWVDGVLAALRANRWTIATEAGRATTGLRGKSPPKEGPLKDIDTWGFNVGSAWTAGLVGALDALRLDNPLSRLAAGPLFTGLPVMAPAAMSASAPGIAGNITNQWILNVEGKEKTVGTREEVIAAWQQMRGFSG